MEVLYSHHRRHSYLAYLSTAYFEDAHEQAALAAYQNLSTFPREGQEAKLKGNVLRHIQKTQELEVAGLVVVRVWACQVEASVVQVAAWIFQTLEAPRWRERR